MTVIQSSAASWLQIALSLGIVGLVAFLSGQVPVTSTQRRIGGAVLVAVVSAGLFAATASAFNLPCDHWGCMLDVIFW